MIFTSSSSPITNITLGRDNGLSKSNVKSQFTISTNAITSESLLELEKRVQLIVLNTKKNF